MLLLVAAPVQMIFNIVHNRRLARTNNSFFAGYVAAKDATTGTAYYVGWAPSVELDEAGVKTQQLSWTEAPSGPLGGNLSCGDTLIINHAAKYHIDAARDNSVVVLVDAPGDGQEEEEVLRRSACP